MEKFSKEEHNWTSDEKIKWLGYGEWVEEADSVIFEYLGYEARVERILVREPYAKEEAYFGGHLCGYVRISEDHPFFKSKDVDIDAHGDITFNEAHEEHWVGFDCAHSGDFVPSMEFFKKKRQAAGEFESFPIPEEYKNHPLFNPVYRNMQFCISECMHIIEQLNQIMANSQGKSE